MIKIKNKFFPYKSKKKIEKINLREFNLVGLHHRSLIKKKLAFNPLHTTGGVSKSIFNQLQKLLKKSTHFVNQSKLKEDAILKTRRLSGFKSTRILKNLPLRGQRTHTNAKTRKKRKIL
jgi:ribosomal protein S13